MKENKTAEPQLVACSSFSGFSAGRLGVGCSTPSSGTPGLRRNLCHGAVRSPYLPWNMGTIPHSAVFLAGVGLSIMRGTWMCFFEMSMHSTEECEWPGKWLRNFCNISGKEYPLETDKSCSADSPRCASTLRRHWWDTDELHCNPIFDSALRTNGLFEAVLCRAPSL